MDDEQPMTRDPRTRAYLTGAALVVLFGLLAAVTVLTGPLFGDISAGQLAAIGTLGGGAVFALGILFSDRHWTDALGLALIAVGIAGQFWLGFTQPQTTTHWLLTGIAFVGILVAYVV